MRNNQHSKILYFSVGIEAFVIGLSHISSLFSYFRKCGHISRKTFVGSKDSKGVMILTFDSKFDSLTGAEKGFNLTLDSVDKCKLCMQSY